MSRKFAGDTDHGSVLSMVEFKFDSTAKGSFEGYASVFNNIDSYGDIMLPGAFEESIARKDAVPMLFNHWMDNLIGKAANLKEDEIGLKFNGRLTPGASMSTDVYQHMKAGALDGVSIGYRVQPGGADMDGKVRTLSRVDLLEISMVISPANKSARANLGSLKSDLDPDEMKSLADAEAWLRDANGWSRIEAKVYIARVRDMVLRDAGLSDDSATVVKTDPDDVALATFLRDFKFNL
ncbi:MAG TPA: HK97 family phage prohead protease [Paraburkholderia sp.]|jgi:HK97 family phage prohead protease|nr:HK97 family phage prohead protease [Paraburkholderia sp.]